MGHYWSFIVIKKNVWMDSTVFNEWFFEFFVAGVTKYLKECSLPIKAVMLTDNVLSNPAAYVPFSGNIIVKFFPLNVTAIMQPMDKGVLKNKVSLQMAGVKPIYRR